MMQYKKWQKGGLRPDGRPGFDTPTGKFEIRSTVLEDYGYEPLPVYHEPTEGPVASPGLAQDFPLVFNSGARPQTDFRSQHHGVKGLVRDHPEPTVEMHPQDAGARGIEPGDLVEVVTSRGRVPFRARITSDIVEGAVECSMGGGTPVGPKAWQERNVNELTDARNYDEISGFPVYKSLLCEVERIEQGNEASRRAVNQLGREYDTTKVAALSSSPTPTKRVYLDNNATTAVDDEVREAMLPFLGPLHGNASSIHGSGRRAKQAMEEARRQVARLIGARPRRIVFTGGGSEADNLALKGVAFARSKSGRHIITTTTEHPAILATCRFLADQGYGVTYLDVDEYGWVSPSKLRAALTEETILVSIMTANNEVGTILPIKELCDIAHERGTLFHTDAVQAVGKVPVDVDALGVDLLSLSGHKLHAPKGVGALYARDGIRLEPLIHGGKQEGGLRAGTENIAGIVALGKATELALQALQDREAIAELRDELEIGILEQVPGARMNGHRERRLPNTLSMTLPRLRGESLVVALDQHGISLSSGSACKAGSPEPTHVLTAMGRTEEEAHCSVRFSLSRYTTHEDIVQTVSALAHVLDEMENTVRFLACK